MTAFSGFSRIGLLFALTICGFSSMAADMGHGTVTFIGSIVDAPCSIAQGDDKQMVNLGQISEASLNKHGMSTPRPFTITLENCTLKGGASNTVSVKFTGTVDHNDPTKLGLSGAASGAGIVITDGSGKKVDVGTASAPTPFQEGDQNVLAFSAYLQGDHNIAKRITPGEFYAIANFYLDYQ